MQSNDYISIKILMHAACRVQPYQGLNPTSIFLELLVNNDTEKKTQISRAHIEPKYENYWSGASGHMYWICIEVHMFLKAMHEGEGVK